MINGYANPGGDAYVTVNGNILTPDASLKVRNHSPGGFAWGYGGSGPAQLALAILLRFCRKEEAERLYQKFKFEVIAALPQGRDWQMTNTSVHIWLETKRREDHG